MLVCFMHTEQNYHFPAVCFWKDLISDAVKYWFSLTSVKALIFLLGLDIKNFQTRFFLAFWASIKFLLMISHFPHIAMSLSMPSYCPQPMAVAGVFPNHLSLVFHYGYKRCNDDDRGNWHANFSFDYIHYWWKELKNQALPRACWKNCKNILALANEIQANFLLITKRFDIQEMLDCVVYSSFNVHMIQ